MSWMSGGAQSVLEAKAQVRERLNADGRPPLGTDPDAGRAPEPSLTWSDALWGPVGALALLRMSGVSRFPYELKETVNR